MTPRRRAHLLYYGGLPICMAGAMLYVWGRATGVVFLTFTGILLIAAWLAATVFGLATSRCPHCRRYIDLRGPSAYCPRCGRWVPAHQGDPPAILP